MCHRRQKWLNCRERASLVEFVFKHVRRSISSSMAARHWKPQGKLTQHFVGFPISHLPNHLKYIYQDPFYFPVKLICFLSAKIFQHHFPLDTCPQIFKIFIPLINWPIEMKPNAWAVREEEMFHKEGKKLLTSFCTPHSVPPTVIAF